MSIVSDAVNSPSHYLKASLVIEPIELTARLDSCLGQAVQYILRAPYKENELQDLMKAYFYLQKELSIFDYVMLPKDATRYIKVFKENLKDKFVLSIFESLFGYCPEDQYIVREIHLKKALEVLEKRMEEVEAKAVETTIKAVKD